VPNFDIPPIQAGRDVAPIVGQRRHPTTVGHARQLIVRDYVVIEGDKGDLLRGGFIQGVEKPTVVMLDPSQTQLEQSEDRVLE
jgi:hypothetical protein